MTFTIKRSKWLRGEGVGNSQLFREGDGKMCCIGQVCLSLGIDEVFLRDHAGLGLEEEFEKPELFTAGHSVHPWIWDAYKINDSQYIDDRTRERQLKELVGRNGHEFVFVD